METKGFLTFEALSMLLTEEQRLQGAPEELEFEITDASVDSANKIINLDIDVKTNIPENEIN